MFSLMALAAVRLLAAKRRASCSKSSWLRSISGSAPPAERMMYSLAPTERSRRSDTESITLLMSGASDDDSILEAIERITATRWVTASASGSGSSALKVLRTCRASDTYRRRVCSSMRSASAAAV